jgi:hypothetical protein
MPEGAASCGDCPSGAMEEANIVHPSTQLGQASCWDNCDAVGDCVEIHRAVPDKGTSRKRSCPRTAPGQRGSVGKQYWILSVLDHFPT